MTDTNFCNVLIVCHECKKVTLTMKNVPQGLIEFKGLFSCNHLNDISEEI